MKRADSLLNAALAATVCLTIVRYGPRLWPDWRRADHIPLGTTVRERVYGSDLAGPTALSDVAAGTCRHVIIYSPTCGACTALAHQWQQDLYQDSEPFPDDWRLIWVSNVDSAASAGFATPGPALHVYAAPGVDWPSKLGISGYPSHIVLDRAGHIVSGGLGGFLLAKQSYRDDCRLDSPSIEVDK